MTFGRDIVGAKGLDSRSSPFLLDPLRSQVAENYLVSSNSRRTRQQYSRWLYDNQFSNAMRFDGEEYNQTPFITIIDKDNTTFNDILTLELKFRLHGEGGITAKDTIPLLSRTIFAATNGTTFRLTLERDTSVTYNDVYNPQIYFGSGGTNYTGTATNIDIKYKIWYHLAVIIDIGSGEVRFHLDGNTSPTQTLYSLGGATQADGAYIHSRTDTFHGDVVIGTDNTFSEFASVDLDEIRFWKDIRTGTEINTYFAQELPASEIADANLAGYINFQENTNDENELVDKKDNAVFIGGLPFVDDNNRLVFSGVQTYAELTEPTSGQTFNYVFLHGKSEIRLIFLKAKPGYIAGELELVQGTTNYFVRFSYQDVTGLGYTDISSTEFITLADFGSTTYTISVRDNLPDTQVEIWVDGVLNTSKGYDTEISPKVLPPYSTGENIATNYSLDGEFTAFRLEWMRTIHREALTADFIAANYARDLSDDELEYYSFGVINVTANGSAISWDLVGSGTAWLSATKLSMCGVHYPLHRAYPGFDAAARFEWLTSTTADLTNMEDGSTKPWSAGEQIKQKEAYVMTHVLNRYNAISFKNFAPDKTNGRISCNPDILAANQLIRDRVFDNHLELRYIADITRNRNRKPFFIGGDTRLLTKQSVRFLRQFRSSDGDIDVLVLIVGTGLYTIDRSTKTITQHTVGITPNRDTYFTSTVLRGQLFITDGKTKIHIYEHLNKLRVRRWGWSSYMDTEFGPTITQIESGSGTAKVQYAYTFYNRELDQYSGMCYADIDGEYPESVVTTGNAAVKLAGGFAVPVHRHHEGATDLAIFRTKDLDTTGVVGELHLIDYVPIGSDGFIDWSLVSAGVGVQYPRALINSGPLSPPDGKIVVEHRDRLFVLKDDKVYFSRIGGEMHANIVTAETYLFPADHFLDIPGNRELTAAISYNNILFVMSVGTIDIVTGSSLFDFEVRRLHSGIGCISHRTLLQWDRSFLWLGSDDIYIFRDGKPQPLDGEGKIRKYIKDELDSTELKNAFAVYNQENQLYELHTKDNNGDWVVLVYDLLVGEFTVNTDVSASAGTTVVVDDGTSQVFYGHEQSYIIKQDITGQNYQPPSGSVRTTVFSYNSGTTTIITDASDLYTTGAGLEGNTVYIIDITPSNKGAVIKSVIKSNTNNTIVLSNIRTIFGSVFTPGFGDVVIVGGIFWHMKTPIFSVSRDPQLKSRFAAQQGQFLRDFVSQELVNIAFLHDVGQSTAQSYLQMFREKSTTGESILALNDIDKVESKVFFSDSSRAQFFMLDLYHIHESGIFDLFGYVLDQNITESSHVS